MTSIGRRKGIYPPKAVFSVKTVIWERATFDSRELIEFEFEYSAIGCLGRKSSGNIEFVQNLGKITGNENLSSMIFCTLFVDEPGVPDGLVWCFF